MHKLFKWLHSCYRRKHRVKATPVLVVKYLLHHKLVIKEYKLEANRKLNLMTVVNTVGQPAIALAIRFLDQHGNPLAANPAVDSVPVWSNTTPSVETVTASADGLTAIAEAVAAGTDEIDVSVVVSGKTFSAALPVTVAPEALVLTSIDIVLAD